MKITSEQILQRLLELHPKKIDLSLTRMQRILDKLGNPQKKLAKTVNIAGTNGKGSVCENLRALLATQNKTVNVYTSPHLVMFNERIRVGDEYIDEKSLQETLNEVERINDGEPITFFEITTAAALLIFSRQKADYNLLECGLGGRLDATNVIEKPALTIITSISRDHTEFLGEDIKDIAREKAGMMKPATPVVCAAQDKEVMQIINQKTQQLEIPLYLFGRDFNIKKIADKCLFTTAKNMRYEIPSPNLIGEHQLQNLAIAVFAASLITVNTDHKLDQQQVAQAVTKVCWPARLQLLDRGRLHDFLPAQSQIWLDGGHNEQAADVIAKTLQKQIISHGDKKILLYGMLRNKNPEKFLQKFCSIFNHVITIKIPKSNSAYQPEELAKIAKIFKFDTHTAKNIADAMQIIKKIAENKKIQLFIFGSLHLAGEIIAYNNQMKTAKQRILS